MARPHGFEPPPVFAGGRPLVFGHRGGAKIGPENTLLALARGMAAGADGFECDVRLAADGVPVLIHDARLDRTTNATGPVHVHASTALAAIDATCRFESPDAARAVAAPEGIPTLAGALAAHPSARVIIEMKDDDPRLADAVAAVVAAAAAAERVCIGSFHQRVLSHLRATAPHLTTSASRREAQWTLARSWMRWPLPMSPAYRAFQVPERAGRLHVVRPAFIRRAHRERALVQVWTVDAPADVRRLLAMGVDGIISDRPDLAVPARDAFAR
ncbi:MAG: glycerophosphodiester phosphodiesterase family protein [Vicinamibacterales bacterium]